jgi:glycine cleavage system H lipoate-binding protein
MTVLLVIVTFAVFILIDSLLTRRAMARKAALHATAEAFVRPEPVWVAGYQLPDGLHYHRGHTWVRVEDAETVAVGIDDFARRLIGPAHGVRLPAVGTWLRQGEKGFGVQVDGRAADFVSPVEGEVVEVNETLAARPRLATDDPYGRGWMFKVKAAGLVSNLRNLLSGSLARRFMEDAREGLDLRLMALSGSVLQDGGEPAADFARHLPTDEWKRLVGEFLLT